MLQPKNGGCNRKREWLSTWCQGKDRPRARYLHWSPPTRRCGAPLNSRTARNTTSGRIQYRVPPDQRHAAPPLCVIFSPCPAGNAHRGPPAAFFASPGGCPMFIGLPAVRIAARRSNRYRARAVTSKLFRGERDRFGRVQRTRETLPEFI